MWPFRRRKEPRLESVSIGTPSTDPDDYSVLTVGQSRLGDSFTALGFTNDDAPRFELATLAPHVDPGMKRVADVEVRVHGHVVGYLRPPALDTAIGLLTEHRAAALEVPAMIFVAPSGPEVRVHADLQ